MKTILLLMAVLLPLVVSATPTTFFGEDLAANHQLPGQPNSNAARDAFTGSLASMQTEGFDNPDGYTAALGDPFYSVSTSFGNLSNFLLPGYEMGFANAMSDFAVGGYVSSDTGFIANLNLSANGFGFFATDFGDEALNENNHARVSVTLDDGSVTLYDVSNSISLHGELDGSVFFWGLVDVDHLIQSVQIQSGNWRWDSWQVDDITTGTRNVPEAMPLCASALFLGLVCLVGGKGKIIGI